MYISSKTFDEHGIELVSYFQDLFENEQKKALIPFPLIMMVDPSLEDNQLEIKVTLNHINTSILDIESCIKLSQRYTYYV